MKLTILPLILAAAFLGVGCGKKDTNVASIAGETITQQEFNDYIRTKPRVRVMVQGQTVELPVAETLGMQALQDLMTDKVLMKMAKEAGVFPTDAEIEEEIKFKKELQPAFLKVLDTKGLTMDQIRIAVASDLAKERLLTKGINVSNEEVQKYIAANADTFREPATVDMEWVIVRDTATQAEFDKALASGQAFRGLAAKYSLAPNAARSTRFPETRISNLTPALRKAVEAAKPGEVFGWIQTGDGFAKFSVNSKTEAKPLDITPARRNYIQRQLALERGQKANDLAKRVADEIKGGKVEVLDERLKPIWALYSEQVGLQPTASEPPQN